MTAVAFVVAAALGAVVRFVVELVVARRRPGPLPWGTLVVNVVGCLLLGVVVGFARSEQLGADARTILGSGALGAFTTFSTFSHQTVALVEHGLPRRALAYVALTVAAGLTAAAIGFTLAG